ncbi:MAG: hypothetical protein ACLQVD_08435 [Capsulimonadaceae bacterium]
MVQATQPWDQRNDESPQAYCAFVAYRDLRSDRSIDHAYRAVTGQQKSNKRASGRFTEWSQRYEWKRRAEAYDSYINRKVLDSIEDAEVDTRRASMTAYYERQKKLSAAATNAAIGLMTKASDGLKMLHAETLEPLELAAFFRAAASVARVASDSEAVALGVEEILKDMWKGQ